MLQKSTLDFLKSLKKNNNRDWFEKNRSKYEAAKADFENFIVALNGALSKINPKLKGLDVKKNIFRIYRDIRFSKNKVPYKTNMGAYINEGGKKMETAGIYFHAEPGNGSFIAGGRYVPDAATLKAIRQEIEYNTSVFKKIINDKNFKKHFGKLEDMKLKTTPKGIDKNHPEVELLKYTSYIVSKKIDDKTLTTKNLIKQSTEAYKAIMPLIKFLNEATGQGT